MNIEATPTSKKKSQGTTAAALGGVGGLSSILIAFASIEYKNSEYLIAITSTIPFVVSIAVGLLEYLFSYIGARNKAELQIDAKLSRKLKNVEKYIDKTRKSIEKNKKLSIDTAAEEANLAALINQQREIQLAHLNVEDVTVQPVSKPK
ncbi:hypothetical protein [Vibrio sp. TBV020]|uniref:hypothetical protein n=1 Tax=Vibrio sp. TBV020 TaxID=3137398 RepID=UPI0038CD8FB0